MAKKILVVEDEPFVRVALQTRLKTHGLDVVTAENGEKAVEQAKAQHPDLILMDIMMPVMDGHEAVAQLKADEQTKKIPVIMLTARSSSEDYETAKSAGVLDYLTKPYSAEVLMEKVKKALHRKGSSST